MGANESHEGMEMLDWQVLICVKYNALVGKRVNNCCVAH